MFHAYMLGLPNQYVKHSQQKIIDNVKMSLQIRINEIIDKFGVKPVQLAKIAGVSRATASDWKNGNTNEIKYENAKRISDHFHINLDWLIKGKGSINEPIRSNTLPVPTLPGPEFVPIRYGSFRLEAGVTGFAIDYDDEELEPLFFRAAWLAEKGLKADRLTARKISGDSMYPGLTHGDTVLIDMNSTTPKDGFVFAVNYEGELVIKRMIRDAGKWWLSSDNPDKTRFPNKLCDGDYCIIIGECVHKQSTNI